jgi:hypothetical protein
MSHIVTSKIKKELSAFAERITPKDAGAGTSTPGRGLTGAELASQYGITTDSAGRKLEPGRRYLTTDLPRVNHLRRLSKAFEAGGWPQVELYLKPFRTPAAVAREAAAAVATPVPAPVAEVAFADVEVFIGGNKVEGIAEVSHSPAVFEQLPEVAAGAVATEMQVSMPVAQVREFTKLCQRWEKEADDAQAAADAKRLAAAAEATGAPLAGAWLDEAGPVSAAAAAALAAARAPRPAFDALSRAYEVGVAEPGGLYEDYRIEASCQPCTAPCTPGCPMLGHRCTEESFAALASSAA